MDSPRKYALTRSGKKISKIWRASFCLLFLLKNILFTKALDCKINRAAFSLQCSITLVITTSLCIAYGVHIKQKRWLISPWTKWPSFRRRHFKCIYMKGIFISIRMSRKFVPKGQIDNKSAFVRVMAWRGTGDKPLSESMLSQFTDANKRH